MLFLFKWKINSQLLFGISYTTEDYKAFCLLKKLDFQFENVTDSPREIEQQIFLNMSITHFKIFRMFRKLTGINEFFKLRE